MTWAARAGIGAERPRAAVPPPADTSRARASASWMARSAARVSASARAWAWRAAVRSASARAWACSAATRFELASCSSARRRASRCSLSDDSAWICASRARSSASFRSTDAASAATDCGAGRLLGLEAGAGRFLRGLLQGTPGLAGEPGLLGERRCLLLARCGGLLRLLDQLDLRLGGDLGLAPGDVGRLGLARLLGGRGLGDLTLLERADREGRVLLGAGRGGVGDRAGALLRLGCGLVGLFGERSVAGGGALGRGPGGGLLEGGGLQPLALFLALRHERGVLLGRSGGRLGDLASAVLGAGALGECLLGVRRLCWRPTRRPVAGPRPGRLPPARPAAGRRAPGGRSCCAPRRRPLPRRPGREPSPRPRPRPGAPAGPAPCGGRPPARLRCGPRPARSLPPGGSPAPGLLGGRTRSTPLRLLPRRRRSRGRGPRPRPGRPAPAGPRRPAGRRLRRRHGGPRPARQQRPRRPGARRAPAARRCRGRRPPWPRPRRARGPAPRPRRRPRGRAGPG